MNFVFFWKKKKVIYKKEKEDKRKYILRMMFHVALNYSWWIVRNQTLIINYYTLVQITQAPVQWIERIENLLFPGFFNVERIRNIFQKEETKKYSFRRNDDF